MALQTQHLRTVALLQRLETYDMNSDRVVDTHEVLAFLMGLLGGDTMKLRVRLHVCRIMWPCAVTYAFGCLQTTAGSSLNGAATTFDDVVHTLRGTLNAVATFDQSLYNDLVLVLRWLYSNERGAQKCRDYELIDCLCRHVSPLRSRSSWLRTGSFGFVVWRWCCFVCCWFLGVAAGILL